MPAPLYPATHCQWLQKSGKLGEWKHPEKLKHDAFVVFQIKQATSMCVCLRFRLASRLAPLSSSPPCLAAGWHAGWVNRKKKGAKDKQDKEFWLTNLTTYQVYHVHGFVVHVSTILRFPLSTTASCTLLLQVKAPKGKPDVAHVVQDVRNKKDGFLKYKKVFCAFCAFNTLLFSLPLQLPLIVCYAFCAFSALCALPLVLPLGLSPCVLHVLHVLQIPRDRLWTSIQDEGTTESSDEDESEEESEEEPEEAEETEEEEDEEGSDAASVKDEDEPSLAQRAPRSTHLEVARMAAQSKGTPVKAKPEAKPEARPEPEELSKNKKEKTKSPPKKKSKGKKKVEEKPKHVRYAVEGEPHRSMRTRATRGEKYQAGAAYDNHVQVMQRTLESEYEVSLGRVCQHYKVCLAGETQARRELGLALLLVTDVRAYSVQMVLRCGTKNAQSTAAARELFEERYPSSSPRQVATWLIKGVSVCTNCVGAPDWPTEFGDPAAAGLPLAKLKGSPCGLDTDHGAPWTS